MPTRIEQHKIRDLSESIFSSFIIEKDWIVFGRQNQNDYGIDCDIQVVDGREVTGFHFMAQLKGVREISWNNKNEYNFYLEKEKAIYLHNLNLPTILILVDTSTKECYWKNSFKYEEKGKSFCYKFTREDNTRSSLFDSHIAEMRRISKEASSLEVIAYHKIFLELTTLAEWNCDVHTGLEMSEEPKIKNFYNHLKDLRYITGISHPKLLPWDYWIIRSRSMIDDFIFCFDAFYELYHYTKPLYSNAINTLKKRIIENEEDSNLRYYLEELNEIDEPVLQSCYSEVYVSENNRKTINEIIETVLKSQGIQPTSNYSKKTYSGRKN